MTPVFTSSEKGHLDCLRFLAEHKASLEQPPSNKLLMICRGMSLTEDDRSRASAVEDDGEVQDNRSGSGHWENEWDHLSDWEKMHSLVRENKIDELENWKAHLAKTDENKENLFHSAAYDGNEETCAYLFDNGLNDIDRKNS